MNSLALDTTDAALSMAASDGKTFWTWRRKTRTPDRLLWPALTALLKRAGLELERIELVVVASGPGTFTGTRLGMTCASIIGAQLGIPLAAVSKLEAMAFKGSGRVCAVLEGARAEKFYQLFERKTRLTAKSAPQWCPPAPWEERRRALEAEGYAFLSAPPEAKDLAAVAQSRRAPAPFEPLYLKPASYER